ncbi:GNAT family protein [Gryllotalpicola daejeonensis]|uniref:GNAT family N-acetyltransferase n=1 Tax=Gryllotalpicola daejeonensis TaxID=993087 RepID=UPI0031D5FB81
MSDSPTVTLRARTDDDAEVLYHLAADLETWEERSPAMPAPLTRSAYEARLAARDGDSADRAVNFVIDADGAAVGTVGLFDFDDLARQAEVGIALIAEARGKGIGTAALAQIVEFGFLRCNLRRLHLELIASNAGALRAYEKVGFVVEGRQREHAWVRGHYEDNIVMGLLRSEWASRRA